MLVLSVLTMGFTSALAQIVALRQLLTAFAGNELVIGITLAAWLAFVAAGSAAARRVRRKDAYALTFAVVGLVVQPVVILADRLRLVLSLAPGETVPFPTTLIATALTLAPLCIVIGAQFPLALAALRGDASRAYGFEAAGAFLGGLTFTYLLAGRMDHVVLALLIAVLNLVVFRLLSNRRLAFALFAFPPLLFLAGWAVPPATPTPGMPVLKQVESRYGAITVTGAPSQFNVFVSGKFAYAYPDPPSEELKAHVPMAVRGAASRVLLIGGSPAVLRELLRHPVSRVDFIEQDPLMIDVSLGLLTAVDRTIITDPRLGIISSDARSFVRDSLPASYDLVILNMPEPVTANINRYYTMEFFNEVRTALAPDGVLALSLPTSSGYIGRSMQAANGAVYGSLKAAFPHVALSTEEYGVLCASPAPITVDPDTLASRFADLRLDTAHVYPLLFRDMFDPVKVARVRDRLDAVPAMNRDRRPVAYQYNVMLWAELFGARSLGLLREMTEGDVLFFFGTLAAVAMTVLWKRPRSLDFGLFTTGYAGISLSLIVMLAFQASFGSLFERIGLLTGTFMAGAAAGAASARMPRLPLPALRTVSLAFLLLILAAPLFLLREFPHYALIALCGAASGGEFALTYGSIGHERKTSAGGRLYALELAGSLAGALFTSLLIVPLFGTGTALIALAVLKGSSLVLLLALPHPVPAR